MPADDDMMKPAGGLGPGKNEGGRLLGAVANDQLIAIDADRWAGAAHRDHAILDDGVVRVIGVHARALICGLVQAVDTELDEAEHLGVAPVHRAGCGHELLISVAIEARAAIASSASADLKLRIPKMTRPTVPARTTGDGHSELASLIGRHGSGAPPTTIAPRLQFSGLSRRRDRSRHAALAPSNSSAVAFASAFLICSCMYGRTSKRPGGICHSFGNPKARLKILNAEGFGSSSIGSLIPRTTQMSSVVSERRSASLRPRKIVRSG